jgi:flagellar motor switch protein FliG
MSVFLMNFQDYKTFLRVRVDVNTAVPQLAFGRTLQHWSVMSFISLFAVMILPGSLLAQNQNNLNVVLLEQRFDQIVTDALSKYYDTDLFLVAVRIEATTFGEADQSGQFPEVAPPPPPANPLQPLPGLPLGERQRQPRGQSAGIPGEVLLNPRTAEFHHIIRIDRILVEIIADESLTDSDRAYMSQVTAFAIKFDAARGDRINIMPMAIPRRTTRPAAASPVVEISADVLPSTPSGEMRIGIDLLGIWQRYALEIGLALGALLLALLVFVSVRKRRPETLSVDSTVGVDTLLASEVPYSAVRMQAGLTQGASSTPAEAPQFRIGRVVTGEADNRVLAIDFLMHNFMVHSDEIGRLFDSWVIEDPVLGPEKVVSILLQVDPKFLSVFEKYMSRSSYDVVSRQLLTNRALRSNRASVELVEQLASDIRNRMRIEDGSARLSLLQNFDFLHHMAPEVIVQLIEQESDEIAAMIFYQLGRKMTASLISNVDAGRLGNILQRLPHLREMDYQTFAALAETLFVSYQNVTEASPNTDLDILDTLHIVEELSVVGQNTFVSDLAQRNAEFAGKVRQYLVNEETLEEVPDAWLRAAVHNTRIHTLASVLSVMSGAFGDRVKRFMNPREVRLMDELIANAKSYPESLIRQHTGVFVQLVRDARNAQTPSSTSNYKEYDV